MSKLQFINDKKVQYILEEIQEYIFDCMDEIDELLVNKDDQAIRLKYLTITIYVWSIIEACLFDILKKYFEDKGFKNKIKKIITEDHYLPATDNKIVTWGEIILNWITYYICEKKQVDSAFSNWIPFHKMIQLSEDEKLFTPKVYENLYYIKNKRNQIHVNVLKWKMWDLTNKKLKESFDISKSILDYFEKEYS